MKHLKVAYDISVLGVSHFNQRARTGIFRVIDENVRHLLDREDLELTMTSCRSYWEMATAFYYVDALYPNSKHLFKTPIALHSYDHYLLEIEKKLVQMSWGRVVSQKPHHKLIRRLLSLPIERVLPPHPKFEDIDLFHFPFYKTGNLEFTQSKPRIFTIYDLIPIKYPQYFRYRETQSLQDNLRQIKPEDYVICISESTKNDFCQETSIHPDRVFVIPLAASEIFYPVVDEGLIASTLKKFGIAQRPYLLSLATLEPRKNLDFLVRSFLKYLKETNDSETCLVLVGTLGWKYDRILDSLSDADQKLRSRIILTGYVPDEDLSALYSGAAVFVYPSLYEGFGLPPLEAMQCGTPVITSNTSSLPEVVANAGIMIDPHQEDQLCQAISNVLNDSQLRLEMSRKSLQRASQFSWKNCAEQTAQLYQIAVNHSR